MSLQVTDRLDEDGHRWAAVRCTCDLSAQNDDLIKATSELVRLAYGEDTILDLWANLEPDPTVSETYDIEHLVGGFRLGLPNPAEETGGIEHMANYRSESTEMLARSALAIAYDALQFLVAPQAGKLNPNKPVLGFDGWALLDDKKFGVAIVLVQVKGTKDTDCPPRESDTLAEECKAAPTRLGVISRMLTIMARSVDDTSVRATLLRMLAGLGKGKLPSIVVAPVLIRSAGKEAIGDLQPIIDVRADFAPVIGHGVSVLLGVNLNEFGRRVMDAARAAA